MWVQEPHNPALYLFSLSGTISGALPVIVMEEKEISGIVLDVDYVTIDGNSRIRVTLKSSGKTIPLIDPEFRPYFYLIPKSPNFGKESLASTTIIENGETIRVASVGSADVSLSGKPAKAFKIFVENTKHVSKLKDYFAEFGVCYEYDILFWKRYLIDKQIVPLQGVLAKVEERDNTLLIKEILPAKAPEEKLTHICFDIETYNPLGIPRPDKDPVIMISYADAQKGAMLTFKEVSKNFVTILSGEKEIISEFVNIIRRGDYDLIVGYNSSNFDIPYLMDRADANKVDFSISRYGEKARKEHHGLVETVKIPGRINLDIYTVVKFVHIVGASEKLIKANRLTLGDVYAAITGDKKLMVEKREIWQMWDGPKEELDELSEYSMADSISLNKLFEFFMPLEIEISKVAGTTLAETSISTTGQLVEYILMRYARENNEMIPNKPSERDIKNRLSNPIEGAYVKSPEAGIYDNIAVFDFRSLYPSIIIAHNIDPSTICDDENKDHFSTPINTMFKKSPTGIIPKVLRMLINERKEVKKAYKEDPNNISLGARSQALKIIANSFYGYLGYARSRWYSRDCAASVTALGRAYITKIMEDAERSGFKVLYGDTDSIFLQLGSKSKEDAIGFMRKVNESLPDTMELELDDLYTRGVFVGKRGSSGGAKKKYAMLSESGRIKIKGFELVRRDWSNIARETQKKVLETILKEGSKEKAVNILRDVVSDLKAGTVEKKDLVIYTQLRKKIDSYDSTSPELSAAKKAIKRGDKRRDELENAALGYIITKTGSSISDKAELEEFAKDYDPDYYINHQVIPATLKILKELGFSEDELKNGGAQKRL